MTVNHYHVFPMGYQAHYSLQCLCMAVAIATQEHRLSTCVLNQLTMMVKQQDHD